MIKQEVCLSSSVANRRRWSLPAFGGAIGDQGYGGQEAVAGRQRAQGRRGKN